MFLIPLFCLALGASHHAPPQEGWYQVRVGVPDSATLDRLTNSDLDVLDCVPGLGSDDVAVGPGDYEKLTAGGFQFEFVKNLEDPKGWGVRHPSGGVVPGDDYRHHYFNADQILAFFEDLRSQQPAIVTRLAIGATVNGETVWAYRFARPFSFNAAPLNNVVIEGLIHAREWITGASVMHVARMVVDGLTHPQSQIFMPNQAVWIVPIVNLDGYRYTWTGDRLWRKNRRHNTDGSYGVDLNRNFAKGWGGSDGSSGNPNSEIYRGTSPFSEPETQAVRGLIGSLPRVGGFVDYHCYAQKILSPWGYTTTPPPDSGLFNSVGTSIRDAMNGFGATYQQGQTSRILYIASGTANDYVYDSVRKLAFAIELRDTGQYGFLLPESQIFATQDEVWAGFNRFLSISGP